jgi:hypothetical protein
MKPFIFWKIPMMVVGLGGALLLAPACKAQSEVSPDHFDGTDVWETAARTPSPAKAKPAANGGSYQAKNQKASPGASLQLAAVREVTKSAPRNVVPLQDKRKTAARKSDPK